MINEINIRKYESQAVASVSAALIESEEYLFALHTRDSALLKALVHGQLEKLAPSCMACRKVIYRYLDGVMTNFDSDVLKALKAIT